MNYITFSLNNSKVHIVMDAIENLRLLQSDIKYQLSGFYYGSKKPKAIINCSYFTSSYPIGRNQGDLKQDTSSYADKGWLGFAVTKDGYVSGELDWWDVTESVCGFTPCTISIKDGKNVEMVTKEFASSYSYKMNLATAVSMFGIMDDKKTAMLITATKGVSGYQVLEFLKQNFNFDFLCSLDGGGSSECVVKDTETGKMVIKQASTDGTERKMFNGLAFVEKEEKPIELLYPCKDGWGSQSFHTSGTPHYGLDFGWTSKYDKNGNTPIFASADGTVVFEGYYPEVFSGKTYKPIGVIIKHDFSADFDYYTVYWHLHSTCVDIGQKVSKGDKIGIKGNTGYSFGTHLHFQFLKLKKGATLPKSSEWKNYSVNPTDLITVYDNFQEFTYKEETASGQKVTYPFNLKHSKENIVDVPVEKEEEPEIDVVAELNATITELNAKIDTLTNEKNELMGKLDAKTKLLEIAENGCVELRNKFEKIKEVLSE